MCCVSCFEGKTEEGREREGREEIEGREGGDRVKVCLSRAFSTKEPLIISAKEPLIIGLFYGKLPKKMKACLSWAVFATGKYRLRER